MSAERIVIPEGLLHLKPSDALESVSMSKLARTGSSVLRQLMDEAQAVSVKVQGQGAMVTVTQRQYDEMVMLIQRIQEEQLDDGFTQALSRQFDELVDKMSQPGSAEATNVALFGDTAALNETYSPGTTETDTTKTNK